MKQKSRVNARLFLLKEVGSQFFPIFMVFLPPEPEALELPLSLFPLFWFGLMVLGLEPVVPEAPVLFIV